MNNNIVSACPASHGFGRGPNKNLGFFLITYLIAMMADNIEHVVSYWVMYEKFHSAALAGVAVISHWLPFLCLSVFVGSVADRIDPRRIIQCGMTLFILVSLAWGCLIVTDLLRPWQAALLLILHGCAGVLWQPTSQLLLHEVVSPSELHRAIRLNSAALYLGLLAGPAVGGALLVAFGPVQTIFLNTVFYVPLLLWMFKAPYIRGTIAIVRENAFRGLSDISFLLKEISAWPILSMIILAGSASFFVGGSYQAQMPALAHRLVGADSGPAYSILLAADAAGALIAVLFLEALVSRALKQQASLLLAIGWSVSLVAFATTENYALAVLALFLAGFFELAFSSAAQAVVQLSAPVELRGKIIGVFVMAALGCRTFSGIWAGIGGEMVGPHIALRAVALACLIIAASLLLGNKLHRSSQQPSR